MGSSKKTTVSYWYHPFFQLVLHEGPFDKLLQIRGGDVPAWQGELTASGSITINAANIWGGEEKEGGIQGTVDISFGEMDAQPNAFFQTARGPDPSGHNGYALLQFNSGRYGAGNPYPKPISVLTERIYEGWLDGVCWYPETANVPKQAGAGGGEPFAHIFGPAPGIGGLCLDWSPDDSFLAVGGYPDGAVSLRIYRNVEGVLEDLGLASDGARVQGMAWSPNGQHLVAAYELGSPAHVFSRSGSTFTLAATLSDTETTSGKQERGVIFTSSGGSVGIAFSTGFMEAPALVAFWAVGTWEPVLESDIALPLSPMVAQSMHRGANNKVVVGLETGYRVYNAAWAVEGGWPTTTGGVRNPQFSSTGALAFVDSSAPAGWRIVEDGVFVSDLPTAGSGAAAVAWSPDGQMICIGRRVFSRASGAWVLTKILGDDDGVAAAAFSPTGRYLAIVLADGVHTYRVAARDRVGAMNPAHVIHDSLVYLQGEPVGTIDDTSFRASAGVLYEEGFGLCTRYNHDQESVEQFRQRILDLIGAECSRYNGKWYLDLIRALTPEQIAALPVLTDDDILDWEEDPTTLDDVVNQVSAKWFDPETKQERITAPAHALAAINALGSINAEVKQYPEVPYEGLADRLVLRDLRNKSTPTRRMRVTTNRKPYSWRKGRPFRLQAPRRGIADMVCLVGDIDRGTLQSGAIKLVAVEHVYAMADTAYVVGQPPVLPPSQVPEPIQQQVAFEAPYVELAGVMATADFEALDVDAGFVLAVGARPANGQGYALLTRLAGGDFARIGAFDWCPSAVVVEGSGFDDTTFSLTGGTYLARVEVGTAALWGSEIVRVDTLDPGTGAVTFGRGCGDTVSVRHAAGDRVYFYDAWAASDQTERATGEQVELKLLTRTGTQELAEGGAALLSVTMDQRAARPYPPAGVTVNGDAAPLYLHGPLTIEWVHRDRIGQADQLVDQAVGSIGPEAGTTYTVLWYVDGVLEHTMAAVADTTATHTPEVGGLVRVEIESVRGGLASWQAQAREFTWTPDELGVLTILEEAVTILDQPILMTE